MSNNTSSGQKSPDTVAESFTNCPVCDSTIGGITAAAPSTHRIEPCGHALESPGTILADGGVQYTDLTGFQRDVLVVILLTTAEPSTEVSGVNVQNRIEAQYGTEINRSRLYQNLQTLVDWGLLTSAEIDGRTKEYSPTVTAIDILSEQSERLEAAIKHFDRSKF